MKTLREMIDLVDGKNPNNPPSIAEIVSKVQSGRYRLAQAAGQRYYTLDHLRLNGEWVSGARLHTSTARAASKQLTHTTSQNGWYDYWVA